MTSTAPAERPAELRAALQGVFGFADFRDRQEEIVRRTIAGRDTLAIMPTGAGKSLCYQLAAVLRPEPTLVLSPLIALMKDQVDNLPADLRARTVVINSSLEPGEVDVRLREIASGRYRLIYAAPERLRQERFVAALQTSGLGLVVIDEVHCVSMWGHDFRPDYLFIAAALETLGSPAVLGLTATATPATAEDIARALRREMEVVRSSVVRANLRYDVRWAESEEAKRRLVLSVAAGHAGPGIIYARSREKCERLALLLQRRGERAGHYHAGLSGAERSRVQEDFLAGRTRIIVATTAFGMGIDKPDVRWVLLYDFPDSLEEYVQRVGRAGRDGQPSTCILLASDSDAGSMRRFARSGVPTIEQLRAVYRVLRSQAEDGVVLADAEDLRAAVALSDDLDPRVLVGMLERAGLLQRRFDLGRGLRLSLLPAPEDAPIRIAGLLRDYEIQALAHADAMIAFAEAGRCRHAQVAAYFGEQLSPPCGRCDVCTPAGGSADDADDVRPLPRDIGARILEVVDGLTWPLGLTGLAAMLHGSVEAPPSAQRNRDFGLLAAARPGTIKRWLQTLVDSGHLEFYESDDGYRLLRVCRREGVPLLSGGSPSASRASKPAPRAPIVLDAGGQKLFDRLRLWRTATARTADVPPYQVFSDRVLRAIARVRPETDAELGRIEGIGAVKLELYGRDLLAIVAAG